AAFGNSQPRLMMISSTKAPRQVVRAGIEYSAPHDGANSKAGARGRRATVTVSEAICSDSALRSRKRQGKASACSAEKGRIVKKLARKSSRRTTLAERHCPNDSTEATCRADPGNYGSTNSGSTTVKSTGAGFWHLPHMSPSNQTPSSSV